MGCFPPDREVLGIGQVSGRTVKYLTELLILVLLLLDQVGLLLVMPAQLVDLALYDTNPTTMAVAHDVSASPLRGLQAWLRVHRFPRAWHTVRRTD